MLVEPVACWCCGASSSPVVRLGKHDEVALCLACAHDVHRRAQAHEDAGVHSSGSVVRVALRSARAGVVRHGLHRAPVLGPLLRWLGGRLP